MVIKEKGGAIKKGHNMKLILLVDSSTEKFEELLLLVKNKRVFFIETTNFNENSEYKNLLRGIKVFLKSENEIMLVRFSGREGIVKYLGDECSQMILCLSCSKKSIYYVENIRKTFANLIRTFEKGDHVEI